MQFNQILAHQALQHRLTQMVQGNRLSHALLFLGQDGSGALPMAIAFAQYVLCEKVNPPAMASAAACLFGDVPLQTGTIPLNDSCGECASCKKAGQLVHPDLHFSYPTIKKSSKHEKVISTDFITEWREFVKQHPYENVAGWLDFLKENPKSGIENPANKQGNITVQECDDIAKKLSLKAFESVFKILILWMPEYLGAAGNKLLKLIEEPPANTLFLLVATDENAILPTILSRTQLVRVPMYSNEEIEHALIHLEVEPEKALQIAGISQGSYLDACKMLHNAVEDWEDTVRAWLNVTLKGNVNEQLKWMEEMSKLGREKQKQFLLYFIYLLQQALRVRYMPADPGSISAKELDFAVRLNKMCSIEAQESIVNELDKATYYIERNANGKMLFHALTIRLYHIIKNNSLILVN